MLSPTVKKLDAFKFDGVTESDNTDYKIPRSIAAWETPCRTIKFGISGHF